MANNFVSAQTQKVADVILDGFEANAVISKAVDTQMLNAEGIDQPENGGSISFQRPMQFKSSSTANGDISATTASDIVYGKATGTVQNVITIEVNYNSVDQAIKARQLDRHLMNIGPQLVSDIESSFTDFIVKNSGITTGTVGTQVGTWQAVADTKAFASSMGFPSGELTYALNPYSMSKLAGLQNGIANMPSNMVKSAWEQAQAGSQVAGINTLATETLTNYQAGALAGGTGTLSATPDGTYVTAKDTMTQSIALTGLTASTAAALRAGDTIEWTGTGANARSYVNMKNRQAFIDSTGAVVPFRQTVTSVTNNTSAGGAVTVTVTPPAIFEAGATPNGQYNNISAALTSGDAFIIRGAANTNYKPNLCFHKQAFGIGFVKLPKLSSTDTIVTSEQGVSMRVSKGVDIRGNKNIMRVDVLPAFICYNPLLSMRAWG